MSPATSPTLGARGRLLYVDAVLRQIVDLPVTALPSRLVPGDVLVVNDAATLPASLLGTSERGEPIELRLAGAARPLAAARTEGDAARFRAVLFGAGDWRTPTELRTPPPAIRAGERLHLGEGLDAWVEGVDEEAPRLLDIALVTTGGANVWSALYAHGRPVQYAHVRAPLHLWDVQNVYAERPWSFEMPSAGRALDGDALLDLRRRGIDVVSITHGAGLSSTGDELLDRRLPLDEEFEVPLRAVRAIERARAAGGRVIAVGTSVVRALESASLSTGLVRAMRGITSLRLSPGYRRAVVDGVLSGVHEPGSSHFELLGAFADAPLLMRAHEQAEAAGYLGHEFGDFTLVVGERAQRLASALSA